MQDLFIPTEPCERNIQLHHACTIKPSEKKINGEVQFEMMYSVACPIMDKGGRMIPAIALKQPYGF